MKKKKVLLVFVFLFFLIAGSLYLIVTSETRYVKKCYLKNQQSFNNMVECFSGYYEPSLNSLEYDLGTDTLVYHYSDRTLSEKNENNSIPKTLNELKKLYQNDSKGNIFSAIHAFYDENGKMLVSFIVKGNKINSNSEWRFLYLVYMDDSYSRRPFNLEPETYAVNKEPFYENWYKITDNVPVG